MSIELFFRNVKYLFKYNIKSIHQYANDDHEYDLLRKILAIQDNEEDLIRNQNFPKIMDAWQTVLYLTSTNCSFCRFGDGEIAMMCGGRGGVFQKYDQRLASKLSEEFKSTNKELCIGINFWFYHSPKNLLKRQEIFYKTHSLEFRNQIAQHINQKIIYGDSLISMPYHLYSKFDFNKYYSEIEKLWKDKDIVVISGSTVFNNIKYNCFNTARSIKYIFGKSVNAFENYDELLELALNTSKSSTKFLILGQTATVLSYDLCNLGHRAIDIGHLPKDYDAWRKGKILTNSSIRDFYDKD